MLKFVFAMVLGACCGIYVEHNVGAWLGRNTVPQLSTSR